MLAMSTGMLLASRALLSMINMPAAPPLVCIGVTTTTTTTHHSTVLVGMLADC
jgi:hypothetical protein